MKTRTITKYAHNMTPEELKTCRALRCRKGDSRIVTDLVQARLRPDLRSECILVKDDSGKILAWGLIDRTENPTALQLYTRASHRRMGLGSKIVERAKEILGTNVFRHYGHSDESRKFFAQHKLIYPEGKPWLSA